MSGSVAPYLALITSEHSDKPNFMAVMTAILQPLADGIEVGDSMPGLFDLDVAVGDQLDATGEWIGARRALTIPIEGVYLTFDQPGSGWDQVVWWGPGNPLTEVITLDDAHFRILLYATAAANNWDGTIPGAYAAWNTLFEPLGYSIAIQDHQDMTMGLTLVGPLPDPVTQGLFQGGFLNLVSAGVEVTSYTYDVT